MARSLMADDFLRWSHARCGGGSDNDVYFSFDDDTEFRLEDAQAVVGTVLEGVSDFSGGSYAHREINPRALRAACKDDSKSWEECLEDGASAYCSHLPLYAYADKHIDGFVYREHQFVTSDWVGGGFFAMSRRAIEALLSAYPGMMLFDNAIDANGICQSDDIVIGKRFKAIGGQSWLDVSSRLVHWGNFGYRSALDRHLQEQGYTFTNFASAKPGVLNTAVHPDAVRNAKHPGIKFRALRDKAGLSQEQLAELMSVPPSYIARVEAHDVELTAGQAESWLDWCRRATPTQ